MNTFDETAKRIEPLGLKTFSADWYRAYKAEHLKLYPHLCDEPYQRSIRNLDMLIETAAS